MPDLGGSAVEIADIPIYNHVSSSWEWPGLGKRQVCHSSAVKVSYIAFKASSSTTTSYILSYLSQLVQLYEEGRLRVQVDLGEGVEGGPFRGLEAVYDGVQ